MLTPCNTPFQSHVWTGDRWKELQNNNSAQTQWVWVDFSDYQKPQSAAQADPLKPSYYPQPDPIAYGLAHNLGFIETNVVKYVTRWKNKNGVEDLKKARECLNRLIDHVT